MNTQEKYKIGQRSCSDIKPRHYFGKPSVFNDMRYLTQGVYPINKCSICKRKRTDRFGEPQWKSDFMIRDYKGRYWEVFTICPICRKKSFEDILRLLIRGRLEVKNNAK